MRVSLTRDFVKKIPIPKRPIDYRDTRLKGLILRAMPSGVKSWYCEYARAKRVWLGRVDAVGYRAAANRFARGSNRLVTPSSRAVLGINCPRPAAPAPLMAKGL